MIFKALAISLFCLAILATFVAYGYGEGSRFYGMIIILLLSGIKLFKFLWLDAKSLGEKDDGLPVEFQTPDS